ncbi:hypothetical protein P4O66_013030 [Electrophorus voltai]|uniref:One cut domain family member n=1 Tax=Electrophorus voltai TaxID=2609070 RepID=A0AAD9E6A2_9TELE|nr:hypothetical protein P4O66_013030 [Electrophorus voltai]
MELTMENIGNLHAVSHSHQAGDLMNSSHARQSASHRNLVHGRSTMVSSMASILDGAGEYRTDHSLSGPLHTAMTMSCDSNMSLSSTYTTLTPLQHLPPISTVSEKFHHHPHPHAHHHPAHQRLAAGNVSGSFTLMRDDRGLASMSNLYGHYPKDISGMGQPLSPLSNGLGPLHNSQQPLSAYGPGAHLSGDKMITPGGFETHAAMLSRGDEHIARGLGGHGAGIMSTLNGIHHHGHSHSQANGSMLSERDRHTAGGVQGGASGQVEEINTKEVAQRITAELKRYSIPQAIFAQRILSRSQGTLSDLLRNPKPWSKLKSGRETFRRMWKWLQEPEFQRMSALRLADQIGPRSLIGPKDLGGLREQLRHATSLLPLTPQSTLKRACTEHTDFCSSIYLFGRVVFGIFLVHPTSQVVAPESISVWSANKGADEFSAVSFVYRLLPPPTHPYTTLTSLSIPPTLYHLPSPPLSSSLACKRKEQEQLKERSVAPKKQRLVFTDLQRRTLVAIFKENRRPSKEMQVTIAQQLGLELSTVSNFFMNARRRCVDRWHDEHQHSHVGGPAQPAAGPSAAFSKA